MRSTFLICLLRHLHKQEGSFCLRILLIGTHGFSSYKVTQDCGFFIGGGSTRFVKAPLVRLQ